MGVRTFGVLVMVGALTATACSETVRSESSTTVTSTTTRPTVPSTTLPPTTTTTSTTTTTTTLPATTTTTTLPPTTTAVPETTTTIAETTTTVVVDTTPVAPPPPCVLEVQPGDTLSAMVARLADPAITVEGLQAENGLPDPHLINAGAMLDTCIGNGVDDVTGAPRQPPAPPPPPPPVDENAPIGVVAQQQKLNDLFGPYGMPPLTVDGISGAKTKQQLCAARVALGLPISRASMDPGSPEEQTLMAAGSVPIPARAPVRAGRWALIDQTCQVMFVGDGNGVVYVFPTSTGQDVFRTRDQTASRVFRYDPARENGGWHDSSHYPAAEDNPLNGNMYKPLYFDRGQAIHGANTVPTSPASHGCVRLRVANQNKLIDWLGLQDARGVITSRSTIGLTVTVQGRY